jgi:hypothetical protein
MHVDLRREAKDGQHQQPLPPPCQSQ